MTYSDYTNYMKLYLWRRVNRADEETGEAMIYLRVDIKGHKRAELSTGIKATEKGWSAAKEKLVVLRGMDEEDAQQVALLNKKLKRLMRQVEQAYDVQKSQGGDPTPADIKDLMRGGTTKRAAPEPTLETLLEAYHGFCTEKGLRPTTVRSIKATLWSVRLYLEETKATGLPASKVTIAWCRAYERWGLARPLKARTLHNYLGHVFAALREGVAEGTIPSHNAHDYVFLSEAPAPQKRHLSPEEVRRIAAHEFTHKTLRRVARLFLFACYTGLSYADYKRFASDPDAYIRWEPAQDGTGRLVKGYALSRQKMASRQQASWAPFFQEADALLSELPIYEHSYVNQQLKVIAAKLALSLPDLKHKDARSTFAQIKREQFDLATASDLARHSEKVAEKHYSTESAASLLRRMMDAGATFIYN